jgi:hypothetical protein
MVTIATVNVGNYRGKGARYVNALYRGCARNLTLPFRFVCFTDDGAGLLPEIEPRPLPSGLRGYYNKLALFRAEAFPRGERVLFLDLDVVILSNIDALLQYDGAFALLRNPHPDSRCPVNSSIMVWEAGTCGNIWESWVKYDGNGCLGGDQGWIHEQKRDALLLQFIFPERFRSFVLECANIDPRTPPWRYRWELRFAKYLQVPYPHGASVVYFHGQPKPDNCRSRWVRAAWSRAE